MASARLCGDFAAFADFLAVRFFGAAAMDVTAFFFEAVGRGDVFERVGAMLTSGLM